MITQPADLDRDIETARNVDRHAAAPCSRAGRDVAVLQVGLQPALQRLGGHRERFFPGVPERLAPGTIREVDQPTSSLARESCKVVHGFSSEQLAAALLLDGMQ